MVRTTRAQREALKRLYDREREKYLRDAIPEAKFESYLSFRRRVFPGSFGCVMVFWYGMWLGIEKDGHTHS